MANFKTPTNEELNELYMTDTEELDQYISSFLWTWGHNNVGQLGTSNILHRSSPVQTIAGGTNWKKVSIGAQHMLAIKNDGTLWAWGHNEYGQLGNNSTAHRSSPVQTIAGGANWAKVACGDYHTLAIKNDGTLWAWGNNTYGQLGDGTFTHRSSPVQIGTGQNWNKIAAGLTHSFGMKTDGTLWSWGNNSNGELGLNVGTSFNSPQQISGKWKELCDMTTATGGAAIRVDGTLWVWGHALYIGDNTLVGKSSPVQTALFGTNWKQVALGGDCAAAIPYTEI
jgi:alpha-tubulin suppressor-like RCC1 family protein